MFTIFPLIPSLAKEIAPHQRSKASLAILKWLNNMVLLTVVTEKATLGLCAKPFIMGSHKETVLWFRMHDYITMNKLVFS